MIDKIPIIYYTCASLSFLCICIKECYEKCFKKNNDYIKINTSELYSDNINDNYLELVDTNEKMNGINMDYIDYNKQKNIVNKEINKIQF